MKSFLKNLLIHFLASAPTSMAILIFKWGKKNPLKQFHFCLTLRKRGIYQLAYQLLPTIDPVAINGENFYQLALLEIEQNGPDSDTWFQETLAYATKERQGDILKYAITKDRHTLIEQAQPLKDDRFELRPKDFLPGQRA